MILKAAKASSLVLSALEGRMRQARVHSSYRRAVNILSRDMVWLSLHPPEVPLHAYCITVEGSRDSICGDKFLGAQTGECACVGRTGIDIGKGRVKIDFTRTEIWQARLDPPQDLGAMPCVASSQVSRAGDVLWGLARGISTESCFLGALLSAARNGGSIADSVQRPGKWSALPVQAMAVTSPSWTSRDRAAALIPMKMGGGLSSVVCESVPVLIRMKVAQAVSQFQDAWISRALKATLPAIAGIIGLGGGLTPAGDDFLTGFLATSYYFSHDDKFRKTVFDHAASLIGRTSLPSAFMLKAALGGYYPKPLSSLLSALGFGDARLLRRSLERITSIGATSGHDMLAGVLFWFQVSGDGGVTYEAHCN